MNTKPKTFGPNYAAARKVLPSNTIAAGSAMPPGSLPFNAVLQLTVDAEARTKAREEAMKRDEAKVRMELSGTYLPRFRPAKKAFSEQDDDEEDYVSPTKSTKGPDYEGFTEVKKKSRKHKRELTTAELNQKMMEPPSDDEEGEVNPELFENARQHEHY
jgi:hypothetical protein